MVRRQENEVLGCFETFVVHRPRQGGKSRNSATYAKSVVASVRRHYEEEVGRAPGSSSEHFYSRVLGPLFRGLNKFAPTLENHRLPILQHHLRLIPSTLNLQESQEDRTLWVLWLTQWQGVMRSRDLRKSCGTSRSKWNQATSTHRGRLPNETVVEECENRGRKRYVLTMKHTKTDPSGSKEFVKTFIVDRDPEELSAGAALENMLLYDPTLENPDQTHLFRDPTSGKEISYELSKRRLKACLCAVGLKQLASGFHCLRIGGATAYCQISP